MGSLSQFVQESIEFKKQDSDTFVLVPPYFSLQARLPSKEHRTWAGAAGASCLQGQRESISLASRWESLMVLKVSIIHDYLPPSALLQ